MHLKSLTYINSVFLADYIRNKLWNLKKHEVAGLQKFCAIINILEI